MKRFVVTDIEYDTDDNVSLPKELIMEIPDDELDNIWDYVSNEISKRTGYCHKGFTIEEVSK